MIYTKEKTKNISFPLGGIGTGCIGLGGNGELKEWEIFNRPNKNVRNGYSHFALKATMGGKSTVRVLQGDTNENLIGLSCLSRGHYGFGYGPHQNTMAGYPHFKDVVFDGTFPVAKLTFSDPNFPATVRLSAFNPLIPHNEFDSGLPAAFFEWEIENTADESVEYALACTVRNPALSSRNHEILEDNVHGIFFETADKSDTEIGYSDLCVLTDHEDTCVQESWYRGRWQDGPTTYWKDLSEQTRMPTRHYTEPGKEDHGTVVTYVTLPAGQRAKVRFVISWNVPVAYSYWSALKDENGNDVTWRNYYATQFKTSRESARYALSGFRSLYEKTEIFSDALQNSTLPETMKDAVSANLSVLKTPTALRLEDGSFWGWEGCTETAGSCHGTCQHVWNYAYAMPYLFPRLERSIRENTIKHALLPSGASNFRVPLPLGRDLGNFRACVDGQMGEVFKAYREWKLSGNTEWLKQNADGIFRMLEYAWSPENPDAWDRDQDGILEGRQHHTLDMELFGPSSWLQGFYLLALDCGAKMAEALGEDSRAEHYRDLYEKGKKWTNENLFNGSYYCHKVDLSDKSVVDRFHATEAYWNEEAKQIKYQVAEGCIIDQMLADWHGALIGAEPVFDPQKKKIALRNLYKNNYKSSMREVTNMWRLFSLGDEAGTVICSYPKEVQIPAIPIPYCEETMTGFEYAFAGLLISEGYFEEGERVVKAIRDRYDGEKRNPWNEIECGSNYARSMASFALMPLYSGFSFDMTQKHIGFAPLQKEGSYLFSVCESWGTVSFVEDKVTLLLYGAPLSLKSIALPNAKSIRSVTVDGTPILFSEKDGVIIFDEIAVKKELIFS
ncbi:MAG: hypothetical protein IJC19_07610 [Clostridia bacterium]|nr:hypothetical protein [Clostridia bacterium]